MKRREFLKVSGLSVLAAATSSSLLSSCATSKSGGAPLSGGEWSGPTAEGWKYLGDKDLSTINKDRHYDCDVVVVGGGVAGISAAVAAARGGAEVIFVQNRAVLGGNASSEIHVPINGSYHFKNKFKVDRETGIVEELQLENIYYNPQNVVGGVGPRDVRLCDAPQKYYTDARDTRYGGGDEWQQDPRGGMLPTSYRVEGDNSSKAVY